MAEDLDGNAYVETDVVGNIGEDGMGGSDDDFDPFLLNPKGVKDVVHRKTSTFEPESGSKSDQNGVSAKKKTTSAKKRKRLEKMQEKRKQFRRGKGGREQHPLAGDVQLLSSDEQAERVRKFYVEGVTRLGTPFSELEIEEVSKVLRPDTVIKSIIVPQSDVKKRTKDNKGWEVGVRSLAATIKKFFGKDWNGILRTPVRKGHVANLKGSGPHVLVLTLSANRATSIIRGLKAKLKISNLRIAKLFARHMKPAQQESFLKEGCSLAVGTPSRVQKLIDLGSLDLKSVSLICFDMKKDAKKLQIFTLKDMERDMLKLFHSHIYPSMAETTMKKAAQKSQKLCFF